MEQIGVMIPFGGPIMGYAPGMDSRVIIMAMSLELIWLLTICKVCNSEIV